MYNTKEKCADIARKFKQLCNDRGTTSYKIAQQSGLSSSTVSCFLAGKTIPRLATMMILCNELGVSVADIFEEREMAEVQTRDEEIILQIYRGLASDKKESLQRYLRMLDQYAEK